MKPFRRPLQALAVVLLMLCVAGRRDLVAQAGTGTLTGKIIDTSGGAIPGALVTVTEEATRAIRTATSDADGVFRLAGLPTGRYTVDVTLSGFAPLKVTENAVVPGCGKEFGLSLGTRLRCDVSLSRYPLQAGRS